MSGKKSRAVDGNVRLRIAGNGGTLVLTIPAPIGRALREAGVVDALFHPELTDDGILFRFVDLAAADVQLPEWAR